MPDSAKLIFPENYAPPVREMSGEKFVWDPLRQIWLVLTPEEWVRRHVIAWLIEGKGVPALRISQEYPVNINGQHQRADIVVIDDYAEPYILVECKAPNIDIDNEVVMQATRYNSVVKARYILLTNGLKLYCFEHSNGQYRPTKEIL